MKKNAPRYRFGGAGFLELERGFQPWVIPKSEARGGAGLAVKNVKRWLRKMDEAMDYEFYDWNLRSYRFKSPFDRRPLIGPRERSRKNAAKCTLRLVGSSDPDYLLQCEDATFGDWEDSYNYEDEYEYEDVE
ncbi:hypothetical protein E2562_038997 [Oryza meyeriana var. granulata]|uniref:Uncharacterized protein n=1 Tax=Oryza meyeriana var. granulata TaxID=110450 RepID=A0A6G1C389_9ORYZ|nr:hypothetical protein E2562_038997 [Oryza meyeriana var. granulata]